MSKDDVATCCSGNNGPCSEGQGHCDYNTDADCRGSLVCGLGNCDGRFSKPLFDNRAANCCRRRISDCVGGKNNATNCCTTKIPCSEGQGYCTEDSHCEGSLLCGNNATNQCNANHFGKGPGNCCTSAHVGKENNCKLNSFY